MIKYRVINKKVLVEDLNIEEALMTIDVLRANNPDVIYDIEDYNWVNHEGKRLGRDPDLH